MKSKINHKERGAAVIIALLIVALATTTAAFLLWQQSLWANQLENVTDRARVDELAISAINIARNALKEDSDKNVDFLAESWAKEISLPADNATVAGQITDQQGKFNINNLVKKPQLDQPAVVDPQAVKVFERLLDHLKLPTSLANNVVEWMQDDISGTADLTYLSLTPPYRSGQRKLIDITELARIKDFNEEIMAKLAPFITALKRETAVNVNTASAEVLTALFDNPSIAKKNRK